MSHHSYLGRLSDDEPIAKPTWWGPVFCFLDLFCDWWYQQR